MSRLSRRNTIGRCLGEGFGETPAAGRLDIRARQAEGVRLIECFSEQADGVVVGPVEEVRG